MMPPPVFREKRKTGKTRTGWHERKALFVGKYRKQRILAYMLCVKTRKQGKQRLVGIEVRVSLMENTENSKYNCL